MSQTSINTYQDCDHFGYPATVDDDGELICTHCKRRIEMINLVTDPDTVCPLCSGTCRHNGAWCEVCGGHGYLW